MASSLLRLIVAGWISCASTGCATLESSRNKNIPQQSAQAAKEANERGLQFVDEDKLSEAEAAFREAIRSDPYYAAGHNNLGLVLLKKNKFYEAAREFDIAGKLDGDAVEPRHNLALVYQRLGISREAKTGSSEKIDHAK